MALIAPAKSHPGVEVYAVASRDEDKAKAFAKKNSISKVYSGPAAYHGPSSSNVETRSKEH